MKSKIRITGKSGLIVKKNRSKVPLKCLSTFRRNLEMPRNNCEINLILTWSGDFFSSFAVEKT